MRYCLTGLVLALMYWGSSAADDRQDVGALLRQARPSVALLLVESNGKVWDATGFVVARPSDGKKMLLTNAHILKGIDIGDVVISAKLPGMADFKPCGFMARSEDHDLMALTLPRGVDPPALPIYGEKNPRRGETVLIIGNPGGWSWSDYRGEINADPITRAQLFSDKGLRENRVLRDVVVLRHSVPSYPGMSGAPVMDLRGAVVGINLGTMANADQVGFCIHNKHIEALTPNNNPPAFARGEGPKSDINSILGAEGKVTPHANLRIEGRDVSIGWLHLGYIAPRARFVLDTHIQDRKRFEQLFPRDQLQTILKERPVAHLINPAVGCRMLVPRGTTYQASDFPKDLGIDVTRGKKFEFVVNDPKVPLEYRTLTMLAIDDPDLYKDAVQLAKTIPVPPPEPGTPKELVPYQRDGYIQGVQQGIMEGRLTVRLWAALKMRVLTPERDGPFREKPFGNPKHELFEANGKAEETNWINAQMGSSRDNFDSTTSGDSISIFFLVRGRSVIVLYHKFKTAERTAFFAGKPVSNAFRDKLFIANSFGMY